MSYIGNQPTTVAFLTDQFSGNGSTTAFTMSVAPATTSSILVAITGVVQDPSTYSVVGTTLTFSAAPPTGTGNISIRYLGIPASGVTTTAYRTVTEFTATAGQTTFSVPSYTVGYIDVYRNGVRLGTADYTASNGTTVILAAAATAGDLVATESFYVSSVLNALPATGGSLSGQLTINSPTGQKPFVAQVNGTEVFEVNASGNVGIGTSSPVSKLNIVDASNTVNVRLESGSVIGQLFSSTSGGGVFLDANSSHPLVFRTAATEQARIDTSGVFYMNSGYGSSAKAYGCRAWVNFNGTGTVAIRASGNVSSITDNGSGNYTVNFTTAMPDANYSATCTVGSGNQFSAGAAERITINAAPTASAFSFGTAATSGIVDALYANVSVFR